MKMVTDTDALQTIAYAASLLLRYPDKMWEAELQSMLDLLDKTEQMPAEAALQLRSFARWAEATLEEERLQTYIGLFDFGRKTSLYMTYAAYGEERERGPALLALKQIYEEEGLVMDDRELSDYLPLVLEFAAMAAPYNAARVLEAVQPGIGTLHEQLQQAESSYAQLTGAVLQAVDCLCRSVEEASSLVAMAQVLAAQQSASPAAVAAER